MGYAETVDILGSHRKTGLFLFLGDIFLNILGLFLRVKIQN